MADLHELMRAAAATGPDADDLLAGARRSGQRRLRRGRSAVAAGTSTLVAAVAVGAAVLPHRAASRTSGPSATSIGTPVPVPTAATATAAAATATAATATATPATAASSAAVAATSRVHVTPTAPGLPTLSAAALRRLQTAPFFYSREIDASSGVQYTHEEWLGHHIRGRVLDRNGGGSAPPYGVTGSLFALQLTWEELSSVRELALIRRSDTLPATAPESATGRAEQAFRFAPLGGPESPAFVATMFTVLRDLPGVVETANVSDAAGRPGVALEQKGFRYIFSSDHGRVLERDALPQGGCSGHSRWSRQLFVESGPVDNTTETVPAETLPHQPPPSLCPGG